MDRWDGKQTKNWNKYVGHRCIVVEDSAFACIYEVMVLEVSPEGRVKFRFPSSSESWEDKDQYLLIEDLGGQNQ